MTDRELETENNMNAAYEAWRSIPITRFLAKKKAWEAYNTALDAHIDAVNAERGINRRSDDECKEWKRKHANIPGR